MSNQQLDPGKAARAVISGIKKDGGKFIRSDEKVFILLHGKRIEISPDFHNHSYASIQIRFCGKATAEYAGRAICQRVAVVASEQANSIRLVKFSAALTFFSRISIKKS